MFEDIETATTTNDRDTFKLALSRLLTHQLFVIGKLRYGLRVSGSRERIISTLLATFDATNIYLAGSSRS